MKKYILLSLVLLIISLQAKMVIGQKCQVTFGAREFSVYGGIKLNQNSAQNISSLVSFDPTSTIQFIGAAEDTVTNIVTLINVIVNKSKGNVLLEQDLNVTGKLLFRKGNIITDKNILILKSETSEVQGECPEAKVIGNIRSERFIGTENSEKTGHFGGIGLRIDESGDDIGSVTVLRNTEESEEEIQMTWKIASTKSDPETRNVSVYWDDTEQKTSEFKMGEDITLTVSKSTDISVPEHLVMDITSNSIKLSWAEVKNAREYKVYSSADPYGTFTLDETGIFSGTEWTAPLPGTKMFYYVAAVNDTKINDNKVIMVKEGRLR